MRALVHYSKPHRIRRRRHPRGLHGLHNHGLEHFFEDVLDQFFGTPTLIPRSAQSRSNAWAHAPGQFPLDMQILEDRIEVQAELPGVDKENIEMSIDPQTRVLQIKASKMESPAFDADEESGSDRLSSAHHHWRERRYGEASRSVQLPEQALLDQVQAQLQNGVLTVSIPKTPTQPEIKVAID